MKLSIFSNICWPCVCLLGRSVCSAHLRIFNWIFMLSCMSSLYILDMNPLSEMLFANIISLPIQSQRYHTTCLQIILQSYDNQNDMVLAKIQIHRPMQQNWEPRKKKNTWIMANNFWKRSQNYTKKKASSISGAGKIGKPHAKEWK